MILREHMPPDPYCLTLGSNGVHSAERSSLRLPAAGPSAPDTRGRGRGGRGALAVADERQPKGQAPHAPIVGWKSR